jgi:DNA-binding transcriptional ArsR family regulator
MRNSRNRSPWLTSITANIRGVPSNLDDEVLKALAEPRRRAILRLVARQELPAGEIAAAFDVSRTAISQHLTVLRSAGLLHERREGARRLYRTRSAALAGLSAFLDELRSGAPG